MQMPQPTEHHEKLQKLVGHWQGEETMYPSQWDPEGGTAIGRTHARLALNGFAVISDYEQERDGIITFTGHGVWTYDQGDEAYLLHWFDCMGTPLEVFRGTFAEETFLVAHGGPGMHARLTYDLSQSGRLTSRMEMSPNGTAWSTLFDGRYSGE